MPRTGEVFAAHSAEAIAGSARFLANASMGQRTARWELDIAASDVPLRPGWLYGAPVPHIKLEANVPDGLISGTLEIDGQAVSVSGWRGTVGHHCAW